MVQDDERVELPCVQGNYQSSIDILLSLKEEDS